MDRYQGRLTDAAGVPISGAVTGALNVRLALSTADANGIRAGNGKPSLDLVAMAFEKTRNEGRFFGRRQAGKAQKQHTVMNQALTEDEFAEVLVGGDGQGFMCQALAEHVLVGNAGGQFGNIDNLMTGDTQGGHDLAVHAFVGDKVHATLPTGYTTSAFSACEANCSAARTPASVSRGCSPSSCSMDSPAASFSRTSSTEIRVPAMTGFPIRTVGSDTIKVSFIVVSLSDGVASVKPWSPELCDDWGQGWTFDKYVQA